MIIYSQKDSLSPSRTQVTFIQQRIGRASNLLALLSLAPQIISSTTEKAHDSNQNIVHQGQKERSAEDGKGVDQWWLVVPTGARPGPRRLSKLVPPPPPPPPPPHLLTPRDVAASEEQPPNRSHACFMHRRFCSHYSLHLVHAILLTDTSGFASTISLCCIPH